MVEILSRRLQIQERLTNEIAHAINDSLEPRGVAVYITAKHSCMRDRGVYQTSSDMKTYALLGCFKENQEIAQRFFNLINS